MASAAPEDAKNVAPKDTKPRSALASPSLGGMSPRAQGSSKAVSIAEPESISPYMPGRAKDADSDNDANISLGPNATRQPKPKTHKAPVPRVGSRSSADLLQRARTPADVLHLQSHGENGSKSGQSDKHNRAQSQQSNGGAALGTTAIASSSKAPSTAADSEKAEKRSKGGKKHQPKVPLTYHDLMKWIQREKSRRAASKARKKDKKRQAKSEDEHHDKDHKAEKALAATLLDEHDAEGENADEQDRRPSDASSEGSAALEMLQDILERNVGIFQHPFANRSTRSLQRPGSIRKLRRASTAASSETDFYDGEPSVPSCNVFLDNSRAVISANDVPASPTASRPNLRRSLSTKDKESWKEFKFEIVRLSHTLKVKGWRRVPMDRSDDVTVERLSGALTNSVYVVTPPIDIADESQSAIENENMKPDRRARPRKLLLRIYGAQVEHLIDRESELAILRRLARKRIGPRMLGTFKNGRFEEHFNARPLTAEELRQPDCSRQIAKRMRELHDGIELLHSEVAAGPFVWQNIDKWMRRCERIVEWVEEDDATDAKKLSKDRVVGADFELFKDALNRYRKWLEEKYNGWDAIRERLVFAHNDAQYGNILRLQGEGESKITPENEHQQLIVIDFEYANANVPGLEFANHFTEWCYNYHNAETPFLCKVPQYPTPSEQTNFFSSYVSHRPTFPPAFGTLSHRASTTSLQSLSSSLPATPASMHPSAPAVGMISTFMLEARSQPALAGSSTFAGQPGTTNSGSLRNSMTEEDLQSEAKRREIERLRWETRAWRGVNSAQWIMWGIVQAKVPGMPAFKDIASPYLAAKDEKRPEDPKSTPKVTGQEWDGESKNSTADGEEEENEEGFDYLKYAFERARFFWGDILALGIMKEEEIPEDVRALARVLEY